MQGFRERETVAEIQETIAHQALSTIISDMEQGVSDLVAWGTLIETIGTCPNHVDPAALYVVGRSISLAAGTVEKDWERCRDLLRAAGGSR